MPAIQRTGWSCGSLRPTFCTQRTAWRADKWVSKPHLLHPAKCLACRQVGLQAPPSAPSALPGMQAPSTLAGLVGFHAPPSAPSALPGVQTSGSPSPTFCTQRIAWRAGTQHTGWLVGIQAPPSAPSEVPGVQTSGSPSPTFCTQRTAWHAGTQHTGRSCGSPSPTFCTQRGAWRADLWVSKPHLLHPAHCLACRHLIGLHLPATQQHNSTQLLVLRSHKHAPPGRPP